MRRCVKRTAYNETTYNGRERKFLNVAFMSPGETRVSEFGSLKLTRRAGNRFLQELYPHRFYWPRSVHGRDYQVCVICGTAYDYHWITLHRVRRVNHTLIGEMPGSRGEVESISFGIPSLRQKAGERLGNRTQVGVRGECRRQQESPLR